MAPLPSPGPESAPGLPPVLAGALAQLQACRAQGLHRLDPVHFAYLEALARRVSTRVAASVSGPAAGRASAVLDGDLDRLLTQRLALAVAAFAERAVAPGSAPPQRADAALAEGPVGPGMPPAPGVSRSLPGPLGLLVQTLNAGHAAGDATASAAPAGTGPTELKALRDSRGTWARLSVGQQLARSMAKGPDNPGPLNSHQLLLRALQQMQDLSPAYLARFMAHAEALLWLDRARGQAAPVDTRAAPAAAVAPRRETGRKRRTAGPTRPRG